MISVKEVEPGFFLELRNGFIFGSLLEDRQKMEFVAIPQVGKPSLH